MSRFGSLQAQQKHFSFLVLEGKQGVGVRMNRVAEGSFVLVGIGSAGSSTSCKLQSPRVTLLFVRMGGGYGGLKTIGFCDAPQAKRDELPYQLSVIAQQCCKTFYNFNNGLNFMFLGKYLEICQKIYENDEKLFFYYL